MYIIIHGKEHDQKRIKGKNVTEFSKNMESIGWPTEFSNEEMRDRVKYLEKRERRPLKKVDVPNIAKEMGIPTKRERIRKIAKDKDLTYFKRGYPDPKE